MPTLNYKSPNAPNPGDNFRAQMLKLMAIGVALGFVVVNGFRWYVLRQEAKYRSRPIPTATTPASAAGQTDR